jgi:chorismate mutase/prephenate dehydratase
MNSFTSASVASALEELRDLCAFYKVLGTYPVSK